MDNKEIIKYLTPEQKDAFIDDLIVRLDAAEAKLAKANHRKRDTGKGEPAGFGTLCVTECRVFPFTQSDGHVKGMATIVLNDQIRIHGLRVMEGENGLFVAYPPDPFYKGEDLRSLVSALNSQLREHIEAVVLEHYHNAIG